jgi:hypothetical protein
MTSGGSGNLNQRASGRAYLPQLNPPVMISTPYNTAPTTDQIRKITGYAAIDYDNSNPSLTSFRNTSAGAAMLSVKNLVQCGYNARTSIIDKKIVIIYHNY